MRKRWYLRKAFIAPMAILAMAIFGFVVMYLWNWLVPSLFGGHTIGYWQAWGIIILSKILFGGFHGRSGPGGRWKHRVRERLEQMTPEEREKFLKGMGCRPESSAPGAA
jgi:hypothetical protein